MTDENVYEEVVVEDEVEFTDAGASAQYGVGPFTIREVSILGVWVIAFVVSFFSYRVAGFQSVWTSGIDWILSIGVPTVAVFLIVLRRFSPAGIRRVGSLGVDQFASVAASVATVVWLTYIWNTISFVVGGGGIWYTSWVVWVEFFLMLGLVFLTVFAPFIAPFHEDFLGRPEEGAHRNARPVRPVIARPRPEPVAAPEVDPYAPEPATDGQANPYAGGPTAYAPEPTPYAAQETGAYAATGAVAADTSAQPSEWAPAPTYARSGYETGAQPTAAQPVPEPQPPVSHQPFWALVPVERDIVDERTGAPLFRIGPTAWALVVADRGSSFLVRHEDGRVGVLYDVSGVTRG